MELQTKVKLPNPGFFIDHKHSLLSIGSCFSENIGKKFEHFKFNTQVNPFGQQYNPLSIANGIQRLISKQGYAKEELVYHNELFQSFDHHSDFSSPNENNALEQINLAFQITANALQNADFLFLTFGTAHYFEHRETKKVVSNCHKFPSKTFTQKIATPKKIIDTLEPTIESLQALNPKLKIILTVSPVRYFAFGHFENSLSKSHLFTAIGEIMANNATCSYFPSYEIIMDELRDYRFYAEDMLHPNQLAIDYVWEKMIQCYFSADTMTLNAEIDAIQKILDHRPRNEKSNAHQKLLEQCKIKIEMIQRNHNIVFKS